MFPAPTTELTARVLPLSLAPFIPSMARAASSLPGIGKVMPSGLQFVSRIAITGDRKSVV